MAKSPKPLQIVSSKIVVSKFSDGGVHFSHNVYAILPGCRTKQLLSTYASYGAIQVRPLFGHNGEAKISPQDWEKLIKASPVVTERIFAVEITPEIAERARQDVMSISSCAAVTSMENVHPDYRPEYNELVMPAT